MFAVPELTLPSLGGSVPPSTLVRSVAAQPSNWRHLIRYAAGEPTRVRLPIEHPEVELWLSGWLPGQSSPLAQADVLFAVVLGVIMEDGARSRLVRAGQTRVLGHGGRGRLANAGECPAVTIHAALPGRAGGSAGSVAI